MAPKIYKLVLALQASASIIKQVEKLDRSGGFLTLKN